MIGPSLTRLKDCVDLGRFFATPMMDFSEKATAQLKTEGVAEAMQAVVDALKETSISEPADAKSLINQVAKALSVKKGLVMQVAPSGPYGRHARTRSSRILDDFAPARI